MKLLIDLGNTRLKLACHDGNALSVLEPITHADPQWPSRLHEALAGLRGITQVWIADVARPEIGAEVIAQCAQVFRTAPIERPRSPAAACGVRNAYAEPERLGIDRFLALVAAHAREPGPKLVASLGTALTIDALRGDGSHRGGLIAPAPTLMREALLATAGRMQHLRPGRVADFGASTEDGLESGCWLACAALIEHAARSFEAECARAPTVLLGGGAADTIAALLELPAEVVPTLVLDGLAQFAAERNAAR